jgi:hypothetical protein
MTSRPPNIGLQRTSACGLAAEAGSLAAGLRRCQAIVLATLIASTLGAATSRKSLLGKWQFSHAEQGYPAQAGATLEFRPDGTLIYAYPGRGGVAIMNLTFTTDQNWLVTNQPSAPRADRTEFDVQHGSTLVLKRDGKRAWFRRK